MNTQNDTLFGGRSVAVILEDKTTDTFTVRQFRLKEYQSLLPVIEDEIELVARACDKARAAFDLVTPASYEALHKAMREVNADGFFTFVSRRTEAGQREIRAMLDLGVPIEQIMAAGLNLTKKGTSSPPSRTAPPSAA